MKTLKDLENINMAPLNAYLTKHFERPISLTKCIDKKKNTVSFFSNELKDYAGIMKNEYQTLILRSFSAGVTNDNYYWFNIHFAFSYVVGGSNGFEVFPVWWSFEYQEWYTRHEKTGQFQLIS